MLNRRSAGGRTSILLKGSPTQCLCPFCIRIRRAGCSCCQYVCVLGITSVGQQQHQIAGESYKNVVGDYQYKRFIYFPHPCRVLRTPVPLMEWNNLYRWPEEPASPETPYSRSEPAKWSFKENWAYKCIAGVLHFVPQSCFVFAFAWAFRPLSWFIAFGFSFAYPLWGGAYTPVAQMKYVPHVLNASCSCHLAATIAQFVREHKICIRVYVWAVWGRCELGMDFVCRLLFILSETSCGLLTSASHTHTLFRPPLATTFWPYLQP